MLVLTYLTPITPFLSEADAGILKVCSLRALSLASRTQLENYVLAGPG